MELPDFEDLKKRFNVTIPCLENSCVTVIPEPHQQEIIRLKAVKNQLGATYPWVVLGLGLPGNLLIIATLASLRSSNSSLGIPGFTPAALLTVLLAAADLAAILVKFCYWYIHSQKIHTIDGDVFCKMDFLSNFTSTLANWLLIMICLERYMSLCQPLRSRYLITTARVALTVAVVAVLLLVLHLVVFLLARKSGKGIEPFACRTVSQHRAFFDFAWSTVTSPILFLLLPFTSVAVLNALIITTLARGRRQRRQSVADTGGGLVQRQERAERMFTLMIVVVSVVFLLFELPACLYMLSGWDRQVKDESDLSVEKQRLHLFAAFTYFFADVTHAVNFFLYFLTVSRFRGHVVAGLVKLLVKLRLRDPQRSRSQSVSQQMCNVAMSTQCD